MRVGLARSPGLRNGGLEHAIGEEVEPLAVRAPCGALAVVAVRGNGVEGSGGGVEQMDLIEEVGCGFDIGEPLAVRRPGEIAEVTSGRLRDCLSCFVFTS